MKLSLMLLALLFAGVVLDTHPTPADASRQETKTKETRWQGTVLQILKDQSVMTIRGGGAADDRNELKIAYDSSTQWTKQNKPGDQADVKEGSFIIAVGHVDNNGVLHATRIDLRLPR